MPKELNNVNKSIQFFSIKSQVIWLIFIIFKDTILFMADESKWSEGKIQQAAIAHLRNTYPELYGCLYHIPNGAERNPLTAAILTGQGVTPGIQDLHLIWNGRLYLIEVKTAKGEVSVEQKVVHAQHDKQGFKTYIFRSYEHIISFVESVILGNDLSGFSCYISPFSDGEMLEIYREEMRSKRMATKKKVA